MDQELLVYTYNGMSFSLKKKEGNPVIWHNMNELGKHYAMWNEPDTERQILLDLAYMWNNKKIVELIETE